MAPLTRVAAAASRLAGLFDAAPSGPTAPSIPAAPERHLSVVAASRTIDPTLRSTVASELRRRPESRQRAMWYLENVDPVISAERWVRNVMSEVRFRAAHLSADGIPMVCTDPTVLAIARALQGGEWGRLASLVSFLGQGFVEGRWTGPSQVTWNVRSEVEYRWQDDDAKKWPLVVTRPGDKGQPMVKPGEAPPLWFSVHYSTLVYQGQPFSPLTGSQALEACEALLLVTTVETAMARSRLSNGILFIPSELSFTEVLKPEEAAAIVDRTPAQMLQDYMLTPIGDPTSPEAIVPIVIRGPAEYGQAMKHLIAEHTAKPEDFEARRTALLKELAMVLPIPESALLGLGDINHWNGSLQEDNSHRVYWRPMGRLLADALTDRFMRPMLRKLVQFGLWRGDPMHFRIEPDLSIITRRPGDWQRDIALFNAGVISDSAVRTSSGYSQEDAPPPKEEAKPPTPPTPKPFGEFSPVPSANDVPETPSTPERPKDMPDRPAENPVTGTKKAVAAAAWSPSDVESLLGRARTAAVFDGTEEEWPSTEAMGRLERKLWAIDQRTAGALQAIADDALGRAYRSLGKRAYKLAREPWRSRAAAVSPNPTTPELVLTVPGICAAIGIREEEVLGGEVEMASGRVERALEDADAEIDAALAEAFETTPAQVSDEQPDQRRHHRFEAVDAFKTALLAFAVGAVHRASEKGAAIEELTAPHAPRAVVTSVLAIAGGAARSAGGSWPLAIPDAGLPLTGHALGSAVGRIVERLTGARVREYEWHHDHPRDPFPPHVELDGVRFRDLSDPRLGGYYPGDHLGCLCSIRIQWSPGRLLRPRGA